jgi:hypothetical protein
LGVPPRSRRQAASRAANNVCAALAVVLCACGKKSAARHDAAPADAAPRPPADAAPALDDAGARDGLTVRVEWKDAPSSVRASPGRDRCGDPLPPFATVHTLHGVADVAVWLDGTPAPDPEAHGATVTAEPCRVGPAVQVAQVGDSLRVRSLSEKWTNLAVAWSEAVGGAPETVVARIDLPVIGHTAAMPLAKEGLVAVAGEAYVVVLPHRLAAVTDATGAAILTGVPPGEHTVRAWLRGAAGHPARLAEGKVTVRAGEAATVTLSLAPP